MSETAIDFKSWIKKGLLGYQPVFSKRFNFWHWIPVFWELEEHESGYAASEFGQGSQRCS
jgi:hypothetical protein